ncbi:MAG: cytochrome b559 subunit alpha [Cyanothece sp. SIO2G6]|nr:cytochrome b559 subunit alpha [Cyanothece sp. SIO2G6]
MAGSTGERPFGEILTDFSFWKLHVINIPAIFISGFLFVATGLAYSAFGTPRPNEYYPFKYEQEIPIVTQRSEAKSQLDSYFQRQDELSKAAPKITEK